MTIEKITEKEKILQFGIALGSVDTLFGSLISTLMESSPWPIALRREYCAKGGEVDKAKKRAEKMLAEIDKNYYGVPTAERYKEIINERLAKLEELSRPYRI
jgi:hypothetical protein